MLYEMDSSASGTAVIMARRSDSATARVGAGRLAMYLSTVVGFRGEALLLFDEPGDLGDISRGVV